LNFDWNFGSVIKNRVHPQDATEKQNELTATVLPALK